MPYISLVLVNRQGKKKAVICEEIHDTDFVTNNSVKIEHVHIF